MLLMRSLVDKTRRFTFFSQHFQFAFIVALFTLASHLSVASAQVLVNGQVFTNGLSVVDAPAPFSRFPAGRNISVAIEVSSFAARGLTVFRGNGNLAGWPPVSGNGKLPPAALIPSSGLSTRFDGLDIFLVSSETKLNITVSTGPGLLSKENGSVRHLDWPIPSCIPVGKYNLTFYEYFHFNNEAHLSITPIPLFIDNNSPFGLCSKGINRLEPQPQASTGLPSSPFLATNGQQVPISTGFPNGVPTRSGMETSFVGSTSPTAPGVITITVSANGEAFDLPPTVTVTPTGSPTTLTMVIVSMATVTTIEPGKDRAITTTVTSAWTTTAASNNAGFVPVNASQTPTFSFPWILSLWACFLLFHYI